MELPNFATPSCTEVVEDSKDGIISLVQWSMVKRKAILAMSESSSDVAGVNIGSHVQQWKGLVRLLDLISTDSEEVVVISGDDVQQFERNRGDFKQPTFPMKVALEPSYGGVIPESNPSSTSFEGDSKGPHHEAYFGVVPPGLTNLSVDPVVLGWNLVNDYSFVYLCECY